jgi:hypothetical protein
MTEDNINGALLAGFVLLFACVGFASCNYMGNRERESAAQKDATPLIETCVTHPSARSVVVQ